MQEAAAPSAADQADVAQRGDELLISASAHLPAEKLRLLRAILAQACQNLRDRLHELGDVSFDTSLTEVQVSPAQELGLRASGWLVALCTVKHHNTLSCIGLDAGAVHLFIEAVLGGRPDEREIVQRSQWGYFDQVLAGQAAAELAGCLQQAFAPSTELDISLSEIRPGNEVEELALEQRPVLTARIRLQAGERRGTLQVVLPPGIAASLKACPLELPDSASGEQDGDDATPSGPWAQELDSRLRTSEVACRAVLDGGEMLLADVARLQVGQVLELRTREGAPVRLECNGEPLFHAELGQADGRFVLRLRQPVDAAEELAQAMITGNRGMQP